MTALIPAVTHHMRGKPDGTFAAYLLTMGVCGLLNSASWIYAAARPGLMLDEVGRSERWTRAGSTLALPLATLPLLFIPITMAPTVTVPVLGMLVLIRRVLLPHWAGARGGSANRMNRA